MTTHVSGKDIVAFFAKHDVDLKRLARSSEGKNIILTLGVTGSGKSVLLNSICDKKLIVSSNDIVLKEGEEGFAIGTTQESQTLLPQFLDVGDWRMYDLAGFDDTRGPLHSLLNACFPSKCRMSPSLSCWKSMT